MLTALIQLPLLLLSTMIRDQPHQAKTPHEPRYSPLKHEEVDEVELVSPRSGQVTSSRGHEPAEEADGSVKVSTPQRLSGLFAHFPMRANDPM